MAQFTHNIDDCIDTIPNFHTLFQAWALALHTTALWAGANFRSLLRVLATWERRHSSRKALDRMDVRLCADIGATVGEAKAEAAKPFWRS